MRCTLKISVVGIVATAAACFTFLAVNGIDSRQKLGDYLAMRCSEDPTVVALAQGSIYAGLPSRDLLAICQPVWSSSIGRYTVYGFTPEGSYDYVAIATLDGRVTTAEASSCTWRWTFFDGTPPEITNSVRTIRHLEHSLRWLGEQPSLEQSERYKSVMKTVLQQERAKLGVPLESAQTAQSPVP